MKVGLSLLFFSDFIIRYFIFWLTTLWRSMISWGGLILCGVRTCWKPIQTISRYQRIAVVQLGHFGDMVLTLPLLQAIKKCNPRAEVCLITTAAGAAVAKSLKIQHEIMIPERWGSCNIALDRADLIIHMRGGIGWVIRAFLRPRAGFVHALPYRNPLRWAPLYTLGIPLNRRRTEHQYATVVRRMKKLGVQMPDRPELHINMNKMPEDSRDEKYVVIHAGGRWEPRRWSQQRFVRVSKNLWRQRGLRTVLVAAQEVPRLCEMLEENDIPFRPLQPNIDIYELVGILQHATLFLGNDSGPAHLAAALGTPCVVLYGPQDPRVFGVLSEKSVWLRGEAFCSPCWQTMCPFFPQNCISMVTEEQVLQAISSVLKGERRMQ